MNWQRTELNQALWKMLADHAGHPRQMMTGGADLLANFTLIVEKAVGPGEISIAEYLKNWERLQS